jgi:hypothetical protein
MSWRSLPVAGRNTAEIDDQVGAFRGRHQQPVSVVRAQLHRGRQEAALVADLPDLHVRNAAKSTMIMLPKNSGFQIGETSIGMSMPRFFSPEALT